ncbi:MAG: hypothetical protein AB1556_07260 [Bacillota bacterium]
MSGKKMTIYLIPLVAIPAIVLLGILIGLFSWRNMAHTQDSHTQDSRQSATKIAEAIAVVEQYNLMKQEAAEIPGIWVKKADWEKVVSRRVMDHYNGWRREMREPREVKELTANILQTTEMPHLQEMAEAAGYFFKWTLHVVG